METKIISGLSIGGLSVGFLQSIVLFTHQSKAFLPRCLKNLFQYWVSPNSVRLFGSKFMVFLAPCVSTGTLQIPYEVKRKDCFAHKVRLSDPLTTV